MSAISQSRIERMRAVTTARRIVTATPVKVKLRAFLSLHWHVPSSQCEDSDVDPADEVNFSGYQRMPVNVVEREGLDIYGRRTVGLDADVTFPPYKGEYPVVITHITLWEAHRFIPWKFRLRLPHTCILNPGDHLTFTPGAITVPAPQYWDHGCPNLPKS